MSEYYKYEKYQKYINGVPADPPEYQRGELIGVEDYDSIEDCESAAIYEWRVYSQSDYICDGYSSYYKEYKYKSLDKGQTWTRTNQTRKGELKNQYATECGWRLIERWVSTGVTKCVGDDLCDEYKKQVSYDMGATYIDTTPAEFKYEVTEDGEFKEECVVQRAPMVYEITTLEDNVGIWIELAQISPRYYINWGESEHNAEYKPVVTNSKNNLILLYSSAELGSNWWGCPKTYVFEKAGTYQVKVWVGDVTAIGGVFRVERYTDGIHFRGDLYRDKYTYKIKDWGERPMSSLKGINFYNSPLTELCDDENGVFQESPLVSTSTSHSTHYHYSIYSGQYGSADYTTQLTIRPAVDCSETLLTEIPAGLFSHATNLAQAVFGQVAISSIPKDLFKNCPNLKSIYGSFIGCSSLTTIPEGLFDGCLNISQASYAFSKTSIVHLPRIWTITEVVTSFMFQECKQLVDIADDFGSIQGDKTGMFKDCISLTTTGNLIGSGNMNEMYYNTKISTVPASVWGVISNGYSATGMFKYCKELKSVAGEVTGEMGSMVEMFFESGLTSVNVIFNDKTIPTQLKSTFEGCVNLTKVNNDMFDKQSTNLEGVEYMFARCTSLTEWIKDGDTNIWDYPAFYGVDSLPHHLQWTYMYAGCTKIVEQIPIEFGGLIGNNITLAPTVITVSPIQEMEQSGIAFMISNPLNVYSSLFCVIDWGDGTVTVNKDNNIKTWSHVYHNTDNHTIKFYTNAYQWQVENNKSLDVSCNYRIESWGTNIPNYKLTSINNGNAQCTYWGSDEYGVLRTMTTIEQLGDSNYLLEIHPELFKYAENLNSVRLSLQQLKTIPPKLFNACSSLTSIGMLFYENNVLEDIDSLFEDYQYNTTLESFIVFGKMPNTLNKVFKNASDISGNFRIFYRASDMEKIEEAEECFMNSAMYYNLLTECPSLRNAVRLYKGNTSISNNSSTLIVNSQNIDLTEGFADTKIDFEVAFNKQGDVNINLTNAFQNCDQLTHLPDIYEYGSGPTKHHNVWEVEGVIGPGCFRGCTKLLELYGDIIPDDWK